eukprot:763959-Hanusia_phi.AAC.10
MYKPQRVNVLVMLGRCRASWSGQSRLPQSEGRDGENEQEEAEELKSRHGFCQLDQEKTRIISNRQQQIRQSKDDIIILPQPFITFFPIICAVLLACPSLPPVPSRPRSLLLSSLPPLPPVPTFFFFPPSLLSLPSLSLLLSSLPSLPFSLFLLHSPLLSRLLQHFVIEPRQAQFLRASSPLFHRRPAARHVILSHDSQVIGSESHSGCLNGCDELSSQCGPGRQDGNGPGVGMVGQH